MCITIPLVDSSTEVMHTLHRVMHIDVRNFRPSHGRADGLLLYSCVFSALRISSCTHV